MAKTNSRTKDTSSRRHWDGLYRELEERSTISRRDLAALIAHHLGVGADYAILRLCREGRLKRATTPRRGLYIVTSDAAASNQALRNPIDAIQALYGADVVFCYGSALYLHDLSRYGRLTDYYVATLEARKPKAIGQARLHFVETPVDTSVGTETVEISDKHVVVTDLERTLIDCIHRPKYAQGWENLIYAIGRMGRLKEDRVYDYLKRYRLPSLVAKTCVVLERFADDLGTDTDALVRLRPYLPRNPIRFSRNEPGVFNKKWNAYVPKYLLQEEGL